MNLCLPPDCQLSALEYLLWPKMPGTSIPGTRVEPWELASFALGFSISHEEPYLALRSPRMCLIL